MRYKQSGDVHPPELDDGFDEPEITLADEQVTPGPSALPARGPAKKASLMPLLGLIVGGLFLYRLVR